MIYQGPDGEHWAGTGKSGYNAQAGRWTSEMVQVEQDPRTGRWRVRDGGGTVERVGEAEEAGYIVVSRAQVEYRCVTRLQELVAGLLANYEQQTGGPYPAAEDVRAALEEVAVLPEQLYREGMGRAQAAARRASHRR